MKQTFWISILLLAVLVAGCSPATAQNSGGDASQPKGSSTSWTLTLNRTGGLAGVDLTWKIVSDGRVLNDQGQAVSTDAAKTSALIAEINRADFSQFQADYGRGSRCNDCFTTKLTFEQNGTVRTIVMVEDGSTQIPAELQSLVQKIMEIVPASQ